MKQSVVEKLDAYFEMEGKLQDARQDFRLASEALMKACAEAGEFAYLQLNTTAIRNACPKPSWDSPQSVRSGH